MATHYKIYLILSWIDVVNNVVKLCPLWPSFSSSKMISYYVKEHDIALEVHGISRFRCIFVMEGRNWPVRRLSEFVTRYFRCVRDGPLQRKNLPEIVKNWASKYCSEAGFGDSLWKYIGQCTIILDERWRQTTSSLLHDLATIYGMFITPLAYVRSDVLNLKVLPQTHLISRIPHPVDD